MKRLAVLLVPILTVGALTVAAQADKPSTKDNQGGEHGQGIHHGYGGQANNLAAKVKGKGIVAMVATANDTEYGVFEEGDVFADNYFAIKGNVHADGSANGSATFVFGEEFSNPWGADVITLECEIDAGSVSEDGTVVLQGTSFEEDFVDGVVVFEELSPFYIIIDSAGSFTLKWCLIPALVLEITKGHLKVK